MAKNNSKKLRAIILGIFDKRQHNRQYVRLIWRYLPGKALKDWSNIYLAAKNGHLYIIQKMQEQYIDNSLINVAIQYGHLHIVQYLQEQGTKCTSFEADWAAHGGHLHIVQYLYSQGINCTQDGIDWAAKYNHWNVVLYLYENGIYPKRSVGIRGLLKHKENEIIKLKQENQLLKKKIEMLENK